MVKSDVDKPPRPNYWALRKALRQTKLPHDDTREARQQYRRDNAPPSIHLQRTPRRLTDDGVPVPTTYSIRTLQALQTKQVYEGTAFDVSGAETPDLAALVRSERVEAARRKRIAQRSARKANR